MLDIEKILLDIYALQPSLKEDESELRKIIEEIIILKPDTKFDQQFYNQLKSKIMDKVNLPKEDVRGFWQELFAKKLILVPVAMAVLAIVVVPTIMNKNKTNGQVVALADRAFGVLAVSNIANPEAASLSRSQSGGGGGVAPMSMSAAQDSSVGSEKMMIAPADFQPYAFEYKGEAFVLDKDKMDVMRRLKNVASVSGKVNAIFADAGLNVMNWGKLSGMKLQNMNVTENKPGGMSIYIGVEEGSISINKNYDNVRCMSLECGVRPLSESDMLKDEQAINAADQFLSEYGVDKKNYGKPEVQNDWRMHFNAASAETKSSFYFPETISVTYPQIIGGQEVYDEAGNKSGLVVNVDIREMKAVSLWNLLSQQHESSAYDVEKDAARLIKIAEQGGFRRGYYADTNQGEVKKNIIELGTPSVGLVKMWVYNEKGGQELIVPSYIFPVTNKPEGVYFYQKNVVVPLIKEILDQEQNQSMPTIMMKNTVEPMKGTSDGAPEMITQ